MNAYSLSAAAMFDLSDIRDFLRERGNRRVAARVLTTIREAVHRIAEMPGIGHLRQDLAAEPLRFYRVYNYLILYRPDSRPLAVVRVLHGARDIRALLGGNSSQSFASCDDVATGSCSLHLPLLDALT